jgi:hypothetical protein
MGKMINTYNILVGKHVGKKPFRRWENNIRIEYRGVVLRDGGWAWG